MFCYLLRIRCYRYYIIHNVFFLFFSTGTGNSSCRIHAVLLRYRYPMYGFAGRSLKKNHEKLVHQLIEQYPVLTDSLANSYIQQLRQVPPVPLFFRIRMHTINLSSKVKKKFV
jgi:hypothetical protein